MKLLTWNAHQLINESLEGISIIGNSFPDGDALFLDYLPPQADGFIQQVDVIKHYVKKRIPFLIYDKTLSIKPDEADWLKKQRVKLYEPALIHREGFKYLPLFCPVVHTLSTIKLNTDAARPISVGYKGIISDRVKSFEKYYLETGKNYPEHLVQYDNPTGLDDTKVESYTNLNVTVNKEMKYRDMKCLVLLGSNRDYAIGNLPDIFTPLSQNVIVLLPEEHKYYHSLFHDAIVHSLPDLMLTINSYDHTYIGFILEIYERIERFFPEMKFNHTIDVIKKELSL